MSKTKNYLSSKRTAVKLIVKAISNIYYKTFCSTININFHITKLGIKIKNAIRMTNQVIRIFISHFHVHISGSNLEIRAGSDALEKGDISRNYKLKRACFFCFDGQKCFIRPMFGGIYDLD